MLRWVGLGPMSPYVQNRIKWVSERAGLLDVKGTWEGVLEPERRQSCAGLGLECREVTSRQGRPAGLGGLSVPHLPTERPISPEPRQEPLVQAGLLQPWSFSPALCVLGPWG